MKNIILPSGWNEVPIGMYQELANLDKTDEGLIREVELVSILADKDPEDIKKINASDWDSILGALMWTTEAPKDEYKHEIEIDGITYYLVKLSSLSTGEQIDLESYSSDIQSLHKFFAMLYRPVNEDYDTDKMAVRSELFQERLMISDVYGTLIFFLSIAQKYEMIIQACSD